MSEQLYKIRVFSNEPEFKPSGGAVYEVVDATKAYADAHVERAQAEHPNWSFYVEAQ
ncbi:hypothetical protein PO587_02675 [Streptomyces gilvifuscus]|uniref:Uncharacterized protein n=1 Tax=Streptomyces gilvifuscus TaxID=1550617 RepID=A0ABT5FLG8_9ACTN|nr:hypothetical protein [Streptomyces gilvifuscus]MDC2953355.1 hypothetical protein [Streptomyces gilvifuscus]